GQVAVVNFEREDGQRRGHKAAATDGPAVALRIPAAGLVRFLAAAVLAGYQLVAHAAVPDVPARAAQVVEDLGGIVVVIHVVGHRTPVHEPPRAGEQPRAARPPAEVLPAQQADRRQRRRLAGARVAVAAAVLPLGVVEPLGHAVPG